MALLARHGVAPDEERVLARLEEAPRQWRALLRKVFLRREEADAAHGEEAAGIRAAAAAFGGAVASFRAFFLAEAPFTVPGGALTLEEVRGVGDGGGGGEPAVSCRLPISVSS